MLCDIFSALTSWLCYCQRWFKISFLLFVSLLFSLMAIWPSRECIISLVFTLPFLKKSSNSVPQPNGNWADTGTPVQLGTGAHPAPWQPSMSVVWMDQLTVPRAAESGWGEMHSVFKKAKIKRPQSMVLVLARRNMYPGENLLYPVLWNHFFSSWRTFTR